MFARQCCSHSSRYSYRHFALATSCLVSSSRPFSGATKSSSLLQQLAQKDTKLTSAVLAGAKAILVCPRQVNNNVHWSLAAIEHIVELPQRPHWIEKAIDVNLPQWQQQAKWARPDNSSIWSPDAVLQRIVLPIRSCTNESHRRSDAWLATILDVLLHHSALAERPAVIEDFVQRNYHQPYPKEYYTPLLIDAWADSGLPDAPKKVLTIQESLAGHHIPSVARSLLRFWGESKYCNIHHMDALWNDISSAMEMDVGMWKSLALGYARNADRRSEARVILENEILPRRTDPRMAHDAVSVAVALIEGYKTTLAAEGARANTCVARTRDLIRLMTESKLLDGESNRFAFHAATSHLRKAR